MKTIIIRKVSIIVLAVFALMQILPQGTVYAQKRDTIDQLSERTFYESAAGWHKQTEYNTIAEDAVRDRNAMLNDASFISENDLGERAEVEVELQRKTGGEDEKTLSVESTDPGTINIGSGEEKEYDQGGRLIAEVINGAKYMYVGFDNVGTATIQEAVDDAGTGDIIIVRGGTDNQGNDIAYSGFTVNGGGGFKIYGGYREGGRRDSSNVATAISGSIILQGLTQSAEINGFKFINEAYYGISVRDCTAPMITLKNNNIRQRHNAVYIYRSTVTATNNNISGDYSGISATYSAVTLENNNVSGYMYGIHATNYASITARNNIIYGNYNSGIYASWHSPITVENNYISSNSTGIYATNESHIAAVNNDINGYSKGIYANYADVDITNNNIDASGAPNGRGVVVGNSILTATNNNISVDGREGEGIDAWFSSSLTLTYNNIRGTKWSLVGNDETITIVASGNYFDGKSTAESIDGWGSVEDPLEADNPYDIEVDIPDSVANEIDTGPTIASATPMVQATTPTIFVAEKKGPMNVLNDQPIDLEPSSFTYSIHHKGLSLTSGTDALGIDLEEGGLLPDIVFTDSEILKTEGELTKSAQGAFKSNIPVGMLKQRALNKDYALANVITDLENKQNKTATEESLLELAKAVMEEAEYIEEGMLEEFKSELWRVLRASSEEDNLKMEGVDFTLITGALTKLGEEQIMKYDTFLTERNTIYERIEALLVNIDKERLPDDFLVIAKGDVRERRKLEMDHKLSLLTEADLALLTKEERSELAGARSALQALRNTYIDSLRDRIDGFISVVQNTLKGAVPYAISTNELTNTTEASLTLDERVREKKQSDKLEAR